MEGRGQVCYEEVVDDGRGYAAFIDQCCFHDRRTHRMLCKTQVRPRYNTTQDAILTCAQKLP